MFFEPTFRVFSGSSNFIKLLRTQTDSNIDVLYLFFTLICSFGFCSHRGFYIKTLYIRIEPFGINNRLNEYIWVQLPNICDIHIASTFSMDTIRFSIFLWFVRRLNKLKTFILTPYIFDYLPVLLSLSCRLSTDWFIKNFNSSLDRNLAWPKGTNILHLF